MRVLLSAAGRHLAIVGVLAFLGLAGGIWTAPNLNEAASLAGSASIAAVVAVLGAAAVYVPGVSRWLAAKLGVAGADSVVVAITTFLGAILAMFIGVLQAPDFASGKQALFAGLLALGALATRLVIGLLTPGETPTVTAGGIPTPPQVVAPASLPAVQRVPGDV